MPQKDFESALNKLLDEIEKIDKNDNESKELLEQVVDAIQLKLSEPNNEENYNKLLKRLKEETINFESKHPKISQVLEELVETLVRLGI